MSHRRHLPTRRGESGSAFILALVVLLVLSILGVSLVVVTETEMQLGSFEKSLERQQYAAETGLWAVIAGLMVTNDWSREKLALYENPDTAIYNDPYTDEIRNDLGSGNVAPVAGFRPPDKQLGYAVETTNLQILAERCPAWSDCGEDLADQTFRSFFILTGSTAQRVSWDDSLDTPYAADDEGNRFQFAKDGSGNARVRVIGQSTVSLGFYASPLRSPVVQDLENANLAEEGFRETTPP